MRVLVDTQGSARHMGVLDTRPGIRIPGRSIGFWQTYGALIDIGLRGFWYANGVLEGIIMGW